MLNGNRQAGRNPVGRGESAKGGKEVVPLFSFLKNLLFSYIVSAGLLLLLAFFLYRFRLTEKPVAVCIIVIYVLSTVFLGFLTGKKVENRKFMWGLLMGIFYFVILAIISLIIKGSAQALGNQFFSTLLLCAGGGMLGGMLS